MSWHSYDDAREQKASLQREIARRRKKGEVFEALTVPEGKRMLTTTFWGKAWGDHLETHRDYESRLPRGRSYLRQGNVYNLEIEPGIVTANVAGSSLYDVRISITPLSGTVWKALKADCAGQVAGLLDLLGGRLGDGVLRAITHPERGLFPKPKEIRLSCSCPDWADMCKHVAAVLYGVGVKLDSAPDLFFVLRSVDPSELLSNAAHETLQHSQVADAALAGEDLSALFGIDLGSAELPVPEPAPVVMKPVKRAKPSAPKKASTKAKPAKAGKPITAKAAKTRSKKSVTIAAAMKAFGERIGRAKSRHPGHGKSAI